MIIKSRVSKFGNSGHIIIPKEYVGQVVFILSEDSDYKK
jgi:putative transposon-encoded protein